MPLRRRRRLSIAMLALLGGLAGAASGYWLGYRALLRTADASLTNFADDLVTHSDEYSSELNRIRQAFHPSAYAYCAPQEIAVMQAMTFRSQEVKEIGRTRDGKLYCSAFLGQLNPPLALPAQSMTLLDGTRIYNDIPLKFAASTHGTMIDMGDVDVVLNPNAFDHWDRPHARYMVVEVNRNTQQMAQIAGTRLDVKPAWILAQNESLTGNNLLSARCSGGSDICIVTSESAAEILGEGWRLLLEYSVLGGIAGFGLGLAVGQYYLQRKGLTQQLRRALRKDALQLMYQPVLELPSRNCYGAEALVRWCDDDGKPVSPEILVRIAEERGWIGELTAFVVRRATAEVGWILRKYPKLTLSINIAASDLEGDELLMLLNKHVRQAGIEPRQIALELTERSTTDLDTMRRAVLRLHHAGYQVHIDDFGTGFSSLAYLHELAIDAIKIDRTFTRTIGTEAVTASILPQILSLAETLRLEVIVEGVETEAQAEYLIATGKRMQAQGWYLGPPMVASQLPKYREQVDSAPEIFHIPTETRAPASNGILVEENSAPR